MPSSPKRVGDVNACRADGLAERAARRAAGKRRDLGAALGMARRDDEQRVREHRAQNLVRPEHDLILALVGGGGKPHGAQADLAFQRRARRAVYARRIGGEFQVAERGRGQSAQMRERVGGAGVGGEHDGEGAVEPLRRCRPARPAPDRFRAHAGIDEREFHAGAFSFKNEVGPQFALDEYAKVRSPVRQETPHRVDAIDRRVDVRCARRRAA